MINELSRSHNKKIFLHLLTTKHMVEITLELLKVFFDDFGVHHILQSDNKLKLTAHIIMEFSAMYPDFRKVYGRS